MNPGRLHGLESVDSMEASGPCELCEGTHSIAFGGPALEALDSLLETLESTGRFDFASERVSAELASAALHEPGQGKMLGVLVGKSPSGEVVELRAFSGRIGGFLEIPGWVGPVVDVSAYASEEAQTLAELTELRETLARGVFAGVDLAAESADLAAMRRMVEAGRRALAEQENEARESRAARRKATGSEPEVLAALARESREQGAGFRRERARLREPLVALEERVRRGEEGRVALRRRQNALSRELTERVQAAYRLTGISGVERSVPEVFYDGGRRPPTGTGDCCAPKLLSAASKRGIRPIAIAECWFGAPSPDGARRHGQLHLPCAEKCTPILGFLLCPHREEGA